MTGIQTNSSENFTEEIKIRRLDCATPEGHSKVLPEMIGHCPYASENTGISYWTLLVHFILREENTVKETNPRQLETSNVNGGRPVCVGKIANETIP